jgi:NADH dehydrogenase
MQKKILVLGATGMLGEPVTRRLNADGFSVRIIARDVDKARDLFDDSIEIVQGDVTDLDSLENALQGCSGVHISVGGPVDQLSVEHVAALAPRLGVDHLIYLSGSTVNKENAWFPMIAQKVAAEQAIKACGVPYTILCPTWPMEQLPRFVMGGRAAVIGVLPEPWHWFATDDLARMVSNAFQRPESKGKRMFIHGPEAITVKAALERYCRVFHPEIETVAVMPIEAAKAMAESTGNDFIKAFAEMMAYFKKVGEPGDPNEANHILGAPVITLEAWLAQRQAQLLEKGGSS